MKEVEKSRAKVYETQVKITIGEGEVKEEVKTSAFGAFDEERYNKYMLDASGPKQRNIMSAPIDDTDIVMQDLASFYDDGAYSVKGSGKFSVSHSANTKEKTTDELEKEEFARILE